MGINKSVLNDIELENDGQAYVQINGGRVTLSFDGKTSSFTQHITLGELQDFADIIKKSIEEAENG